MIDLRSDTITKPTAEMLDAMMSAKVGDDVFGEDPTVNDLQKKIANMFGMEDAIFCPSGTMTNQIAIRLHTVPQDEVICHELSHIYLYEGGGMMYNSMVSPKLLKGEWGKLTKDTIQENINPDDIHLPKTKLLVLENTFNKGGGSIYTTEEIQPLEKLCRQNGLKLHLDGARLFNALIETKDNKLQYGHLFDTISICFSKGLGAPVGSALLGTKESIQQARRIRKVLGGAMRQAGYLAAACIYALDHHTERLKEDHQHAKAIGHLLLGHEWIDSVYPVQTNIVIAKMKNQKCSDEFLARLDKLGVKGISFGKGLVRFVTHIQFQLNDLNQFEFALKKIA